jgi:hypothetical protein
MIVRHSAKSMQSKLLPQQKTFSYRDEIVLFQIILFQTKKLFKNEQKRIVWVNKKYINN